MFLFRSGNLREVSMTEQERRLSCEWQRLQAQKRCDSTCSCEGLLALIQGLQTQVSVLASQINGSGGGGGGGAFAPALLVQSGPSKKVLALPAAAVPLNGTEVLPGVQGGSDVGITAQSVAKLASGSGPASTVLQVQGGPSAGITGLPAAGTLDGTEPIAVVQTGGASMPVLVQSTFAQTDTFSTGNLLVTFPNPTTGGNFLFVAFVANGSTASVVTPSGWTQAASVPTLFLFYRENAPSTVNQNFTVFNNGTPVAYCCGEFANVLTSGSIDQTGTGSGSSNSLSVTTGGATVAAPELALACYWKSDTNGIDAPGGSWTPLCSLPGSPGNNPSLFFGWQTLVATGSPVMTATLTGPGTNVWAGIIATFQTSGSVPVTVQTTTQDIANLAPAPSGTLTPTAELGGGISGVTISYPASPTPEFCLAMVQLTNNTGAPVSSVVSLSYTDPDGGGVSTPGVITKTLGTATAEGSTGFVTCIQAVNGTNVTASATAGSSIALRLYVSN
jgi:hypothetical protein